MSIVYPVVMTVIRMWFGGRSQKILRKGGQGFRRHVMEAIVMTVHDQLLKYQIGVWRFGESRSKRER